MALFFSSVLAAVAFILATCYLVMHLFTSNIFTYWKKRGVHYVKPISTLDRAKDIILRRKNTTQDLQKIYEENAGQPYVGLYISRKPVLMVRDLDLLRFVFVKDAQVFLDRYPRFPKSEELITRSLFMLTGKEWRGLRIKLTPTFTSGKIKRMFNLINECGEALLSCIEQEISKGGTITVKDLISRYSTDVIVSCAFGVNANALTDPNCEFITTVKKMFEPTLSKKIGVALSFLLSTRLRKNLGLNMFDPAFYNLVRKTFWDVVDYRKKNKVVRNDFVDLLVQIRQEGQVRADDTVDLEEIEQDSKYIEQPSVMGKSDDDLDDNDLLAQAVIFILAGLETSSSITSFALYELALHPDVQERLRQEIQSVLDKHNNEISYDAIAEMTYLDMVMSETMRKYPSLPTLERMCLSDYKFQGTDCTIQKGTKVFIPVKAIHYDPDIYPDPENFDPERFSAENKSKRSNFTYLPFGEGPRICIGMRFGKLQVKTALVHVMTSFQVRPCPDTPKPGGDNSVLLKSIVLAFKKLK